MFQTTNILIVDDDEGIVRVFERLAREQGWTFSVARSGEEAVELLGKKVFEAAVVDIRLPGFTGLQLLEQCKRNNVNTEIVIMTGVGSVETAVQAMKNGAYDYLTKPFEDIGRVAIILDKAMDRYRMAARLRRLRAQERRRPRLRGDPGEEPRDAGDLRLHREHRAHDLHGAHHGRERHGQGAGGARHPRAQPAAATSPSS